jgi:hypothetical protein
MTTLLLEGFEGVVGGYVFDTADKFSRAFQAMPFSSGYAGRGAPYIDVTDGRVAGNSLACPCAAGENVSLDLGWSFDNKSSFVMGFAFRYDAVPTEGIPIIEFKTDDGNVNLSQLALFGSPSGRLYFAGNTVGNTKAATGAAMMNQQGATADRMIRWTTWNYVEVSVNYSPTIPVVSVRLNGQLVVNGLADPALRKQDEKFINHFKIWVAGSDYFGGAECNAWVDDIYFLYNTTIMQGPQQIIDVRFGEVVRSENMNFVPNRGKYSGATGAHTTSGLLNLNRFKTTDVAADPTYDSFTAIQEYIYASSADSLTGAEFRLVPNGNSSDNDASFNGNTSIQTYETLPGMYRNLSSRQNTPVADLNAAEFVLGAGSRIL